MAFPQQAGELIIAHNPHTAAASSRSAASSRPSTRDGNDTARHEKHRAISTSAPKQGGDLDIVADLQRGAPGDPNMQAIAKRTPEEALAAKRRNQFYGDVLASREPAASARERVSRDSVITAEVKTNVIIKDEYTFLTSLSTFLSHRYSRPQSSVLITLAHSSCLLLGGSFEPAYLLTLSALPSLVAPTMNKRNAALIQAHMADELRVPSDRGVVRFVAMPESNLATAGTTALAEIEAQEKAAGPAQPSSSSSSQQQQQQQQQKQIDAASSGSTAGTSTSASASASARSGAGGSLPVSAPVTKQSFFSRVSSRRDAGAKPERSKSRRHEPSAESERQGLVEAAAHPPLPPAPAPTSQSQQQQRPTSQGNGTAAATRNGAAAAATASENAAPSLGRDKTVTKVSFSRPFQNGAGSRRGSVSSGTEDRKGKARANDGGNGAASSGGGGDSLAAAVEAERIAQAKQKLPATIAATTAAATARDDHADKARATVGRRKSLMQVFTRSS